MIERPVRICGLHLCVPLDDQRCIVGSHNVIAYRS